MEALAHTLVYDTVITSTFPLARLSTITTPTLVIDSEGTDGQLRGWADGAAEALPNGSRRTLPGEWHGVAPEILAPAMVAFFIGR